MLKTKFTDIEVAFNSLTIYVQWSAKEIGFGELDIRYDQEQDVIICDSETMSPAFVRAVLNKITDKLVTEAIYDGTPEFKEFYIEYFANKRKKDVQFPGNGI